jgi:hypothetical protein
VYCVKLAVCFESKRYHYSDWFGWCRWTWTSAWHILMSTMSTGVARVAWVLRVAAGDALALRLASSHCFSRNALYYFNRPLTLVLSRHPFIIH